MKVKRDEFLTQLERLSPAIASNSKIPALLHVWFDGKHAHAYDSGLGIMVPLMTDFELGVPGKTLLGLMSGTNVEEIDLSADGERNLGIKIGRSKVTLGALPPEGTAWKFPAKLPPKTPFIELTEAFLDGLRRVLLVKPPKEKSRVEHWGVTLFPTEKGVKLMTTNSKALAQIEVEGKVPKEADKLVIPRDFVEQVIAQCAPGAKMYVLTDCIIAVGENVRLYSNRQDGSGVSDLPGLVGRILNGDGEVEEIISVPKGLGAAVNRAELLASGESEPNLTLSVDKGQLGLCGFYKLGELTDTLDLGKEKASTASINVELGQLQIALREAEQFSIAPRALALRGSGGFLCIIAGHAEKK